MNIKTKKITLSAMFVAVAMCILYLGSLLPSWKFATSALAGILTAAALVECGKLSAVLVYIVVGVLALILLPQKSLSILYIVFFGYYPIIKSISERMKNRAWEWIIKFAVFNAAAILSYMALKYGFMSDIKFPDFGIYFIWIILNVAFLIFDFGFSKLITFYMNRIHGKLK